MTDTVRSIIQDSLEEMKVYAPGVSVKGSDAATCQRVMAQMLDTWSNDRLACYANLEQSFLLQPGKQSYTIGTSGGADIALDRPLEILVGPGRAYLLDAANQRFPLDVVEQDQWNQIVVLNQITDLPDTLFYDPQFPLGIINVFGNPGVANRVFFDSRLRLQDVSTLDTQIILPPGYVRAIRTNLSCEAWRFFKVGSPDKDLSDDAKTSLAAIKRTNIKQSPSKYDAAVISKAGGGYNIFNDSTNRGTG
jgi:hypothetical protein